MPIHTIETQEYECVHCGYKWVNRVNGKDGSIPQRCAKCKRYYWNDGQHEQAGRNPNPITPKERGLRVRLGGCEPNELCEKFLSLKPRPTIEKLEYALYPLGYNPRDHKGHVLGERVEGQTYKLVRNWKGYIAVLEKEALRRKEFMQEVIDSRTNTKPVFLDRQRKGKG